MLKTIKSIFRSPINSWSDLADDIGSSQSVVETELPQPPLNPIIIDGGSTVFCEECGSSMYTNWLGMSTKYCVHPKCDNYYGNVA